MGPEDKVEMNNQNQDDGMIPGLDMDSAEDKSKVIIKKVNFGVCNFKYSEGYLIYN